MPLLMTMSSGALFAELQAPRSSAIAIGTAKALRLRTSIKALRPYKMASLRSIHALSLRMPPSPPVIPGQARNLLLPLPLDRKSRFLVGRHGDLLGMAEWARHP